MRILMGCVRPLVNQQINKLHRNAINDSLAENKMNAT